MKRFMLVALAFAMFSTTACGGDPCAEVVAKACDGVKDCKAFEKFYGETVVKKMGDGAKDACKATLASEPAMKGLKDSAKAMADAPKAK